MHELPRDIDWYQKLRLRQQQRPPLTPDQIAQRKERRNEKQRAARVVARDARRAARVAASEDLRDERPVILDWAPLMRVWS